MGCILFHTKYILDLFECDRLSDYCTIYMPLKCSAKYFPTDGVCLSDPCLYRNIIANLVYLTTIRPNIAHVVHVVSQFVTAPSNVYWGAVLHILKYLCGTQFRSLMFPSMSFFQLRAYNDADWDSDVYDSKSTIGYCMFVGDLLIL